MGRDPLYFNKENAKLILSGHPERTPMVVMLTTTSMFDRSEFSLYCIDNARS